MHGREFQTLADCGLMGSDYDHIEDRNVYYSSEYDDVEIVTETSLHSNFMTK
ncbi:hypothetical protein DPMN_111743 [Dreissena polymorpha]|uniref:Uncharacterized protein n=1 Tax=Dreissena polymorpha TaxID=45954 RepID=A0A9D4QQ87_DREPO|nr:hypothetical protein DPMN_111743 [Dreissena polymorpha]